MESVRQLKLVNALGSNDVDIVMSAVLKQALEAAQTPSYGSPLHLVITLCPKAIIEHVVSTFLMPNGAHVNKGNASTWINARNYPDGETPLHIASKLGRADVLELLFRVPTVNDTLRSSAGKTPEEVAKNSHIAEMFAKQRDDFCQFIQTQVKEFIDGQKSQAVIDLFDHNDRARSYLLNMGWIDINAPIDLTTDGCILHYAAKKDDLALVEWALSLGADPNVKDRRGKKPTELCKKDKVKERLKAGSSHVPMHSPQLVHSVSMSGPGFRGIHDAPVLKGLLLKWTNYRSGYKSRYFVLENGTFSYYHASSDYPHNCRGSISTQVASITMPESSDSERFDVEASGNVKYSLKARSPAEAKKWVWYLMESKRYMSDLRTSTTNLNVSVTAPAETRPELSEEDLWESVGEMSMDEDVHETTNAQGQLVLQPLEDPLLDRVSSVLNEIKLRNAESVDIQQTLKATPSEQLGKTLKKEITSTSMLRGDLTPDYVEGPRKRSIIVNPDQLPLLQSKIQKNVHPSNIHALLYLLEVQLEVQERVVHTMIDSVGPAGLGKMDAKTLQQTYEQLAQLPDLLKNSVEHIQDTAKRIVALYDSRETMWNKRFWREVECRKRWEEVVASVVGIDHIDMVTRPSSPNESRQGIHNHSNRPGSSNSTRFNAVMEAQDEDEEGDVFYDANEGQETFLEAAFGFSAMDSNDMAPESKSPVRKLSLSPNLARTIFPAVEALLASASSYAPISTMRKQLPLDPNAPKPSLAVWSFLRSAIGKDLTKVTLPVFFNEPLSMLQRMCEDIEYIELMSLAGATGSKGCMGASAATQTPHPASQAASVLGLDISTIEHLEGQDASLLRIMLVGAYAMSNYSSTVGRTGKPFNPMLGETYELVRPDKRYRYLSEQVCHHPPISACYCESPEYIFWTEVNVRSRFWGKALELHPLGTCHASLPLYGFNEDAKSNVVCGSEHYSWKKVTTSVNNLIVGKLSIDHQGDMVIRNWRTGEECTITFKPKETGGWFGGVTGSKDELNECGELVGNVKDANGNICFELKGRWDDKLVATAVGAFRQKCSTMMQKPIMLWKRTPLPSIAPQNFNFTEFAMQLNEMTPGLRQSLPLTDSRLRPDQKMMEEGRWEKANKNKDKLENYQRQSRKKILAEFNATGIPNGPKRPVQGIDIGESWWTPRWFIREVEPNTNEPHWKYTNEYWGVKEEAKKTEKWPPYIEDIFGVNDPSLTE